LPIVISHRNRMGNAQARKRLRSSDFAYIAKHTAFLTKGIVEEYYKKIMAESPEGKMQPEEFKKIFQLAFPERPEDKLDILIEELKNKNGEIAVASLLMMIYLFSDGTPEAKLGQIFDLFDEDGNGSVSVTELLNLMAFFIELGEGKNHKVDMACVMCEMYNLGDSDKNEMLEKNEFIRGMKSHEVTSKILRMNTIDTLLSVL